MQYFPAGGEFLPSIHAAMLTFADRALITAYPFLTDDTNLPVLDYLLEGMQGRPLILDSGIFSMNALKDKGREYSKEEVIAYCKKYIKLIKDYKFTGLIIDVDCHELCPNWIEVLYTCREMLYAEFGNRLIVTWHESGTIKDWEMVTKGYERFATNSWDLANLSKKMEAQTGRKYTKADVVKVLHKRASVNIDEHHFHILGATGEEYFSWENNFSCDSTTWSMIVRFGRSFPYSNFAVTWWRKKEVRAPKAVLDIVDAKRDELYRNFEKSPVAVKKQGHNPNPDFTYALACSLVASQLYAESISKKYKFNNPIMI